MKINKNIKSLFNLSKFLSKYLWVYFVLLAIASLFPLSDYISSATQASLLILCFPLLIIENLMTVKQVRFQVDQDRLRFLKNNVTFPYNVTLGGDKYHFEKVVTITVPEKNFVFRSDDLNYKSVFNENDTLVIDYFRKEINLIIQVRYSKND
jgi:hypothetical protein